MMPSRITWRNSATLYADVTLSERGTNGFSMNLKFLNYDQSNECTSMRDSSVSYAAAVYTFG